MIKLHNYFRFKIIIIPALCMTLYVVLYIISLQIEATYQIFVSQLAKDLQVSIIEQDYHRGIFKSEANFYAKSPTFDHPFLIKSTIYHGPIDYNVEDKLFLHSGLANSNSRIFLKDKVMIKADSNISFDKKLSSNISFPSYVSQQNLNTKVIPVGKLDYDYKNRMLSGVLQSEKLSYHDSSGELLIIQPHLSWSMSFTTNKFPVGEIVINIGSLELRLQQETLHVDSLMWTSQNTIEDSLMNNVQRLEISSLSIGENAFGTVVFSLIINGLNSASLKLQDPSTTNWFELFSKILTEQTTLSLEPFSMTNSEGTFLAHSLLQIKSPQYSSQQDFFNDLIFDADISMPQAMLNSLIQPITGTSETVINSLKKRGLLIEEENDYKSLISFRDGYLTINGMRTKLSDLLYVY